MISSNFVTLAIGDLSKVYKVKFDIVGIYIFYIIIFFF